jgi:hypothetical protein
MKKSITCGKSIVITIVLLLGANVIPGFADNIATPQDGEYIISLGFDSFDLSFGTQMRDEGEFATIELLDEGFSTNIGQSKLPMMRAMVEIPQGSNPEIVILSDSWESTTLSRLTLPDQIIPVQPSVEKDKGTPDSADFVIDTDFYNQDVFFPIDTVNIVETGEIRGRRFALVEISPVQYNPSTCELRIMSSCNVEIQLDTSNLEQTYQNMQRYYSPRYENLFKATFINYGELEYDIVFSEKDPQGFLFIVYDDFFDEIQPLVDLKESHGYDVTVTKTSDIPGGPTIANIENYIDDAYTNWPTPPTYILLVGDTGQIPTKTSGLQGGVSCSDLYYVTINPEDYIPDIYIGRFPAATASQVTAMVEKTVYYESGGFLSNEWTKKGVFIASSDYGQLAEETHNYVIDNYLTPNNYTCDKIYQASGGSTSNIFDSLNDGRSLCVYSGHGYPGGWSCVPFDKTDVSSLTNTDMYPFVCSHACSTSTFDDAECYGETWLRVENKGGIAFWGASASTYWDEDDILEKRMFQACWDDNLTTIGGMTDMALIYLYTHYGGGGLSKYYFEGYNVLGDASVVLAGEAEVNTPPDTPDTPEGPDEGETEIEYTFTTATTDPEEDQVSYMFDWGDGTFSDWIGPVLHQTPVQGSHAWGEEGVYEVRAKAKDVNDDESDWSDTHTITIVAGPTLDIGTIKGGLLRISVPIKNIGSTAANGVQWSINLEGGAFIGKETNGTDDIPAGGEINATSGLIIGFGETVVTVTAEISGMSDIKEQDGFVFFFFTKVNPGSGI